MGIRALVAFGTASAVSLAVVACSSFSSGGEPIPGDAGGDASTDVGDGAEPPEPPLVDAGPRVVVPRACPIGAPFGEPKPIAFASPLPTGFSRTSSRLTDDELTIYWTQGPGASLDDLRIMRATRASTKDGFGAPVEATELSAAFGPVNVNGYVGVLDPWVSSKADAVYYTKLFVGTPTGPNKLAIYGETWAATKTNGKWSTPGRVVVAPGASEIAPFVTDDTFGTMFFASGPKDDLASADLVYVVRESGGSFGPVRPIGTTGAFATPALEGISAISADGLEIFFQFQAPGAKARIHFGKRATTNDAFGPPSAIDDSEPGTATIPGWLSPDGCRLDKSTSDTNGVFSMNVRSR